MDIFEILREAKNPSNSTKTETLKIDSTDDSAEYVDEAEKDVDEAEDISDVEEEETSEEDTDDTEEEVDETEDTESDDTEDDSMEDEPTDYTTEVDEVGPDEDADESTEGTEDTDTETSDTEESKEQDDKNGSNSIALLNSSIRLYYDLKDAMTKLDQINQIDIIANKIIIQAKRNFSKLSDELYEFITRTYSLNSYVKNLYTYNYFIEAYKVNVEMLKKINVFTSNT